MAFFFRSNRTPPPPAPDESLLHVPLRSFTVPTLGVEAKISYLAPTGDTQAQEFETAVRTALRAIEQRFSLSEPGSIVSQINAAAGKAPVAVDRETEKIFELCDSLVFMTQGRVDPSVLPLLRLWRQSNEMPAMEDIAEAKALVGWNRVQRSSGQVFLPIAGMGVDFGCFLMGMAAETVAAIARERRIPSALASVGSVHRALGAAPGKSAWDVQVSPVAEGGSSFSVSLMDSALAIAGGGPGILIGERRSSSVLDLKSGWPVPPQTFQAVVVGPSALKAPVVALTAFVLGVPAGIEFVQGFPGFEGTIDSASGRGVSREWLHRLTQIPGAK